MEKHLDLVIVGGGMVGASLACALSPLTSQGLRMAVLESAPLRPTQVLQPGFDARSTVLSHVSAEYFRRLGLWPEMAQRAQPITTIHVSDQGRLGAVRLHSQEHGVPALGYVVENATLGQVLNRHLMASSGVELHGSTRVLSLSPRPEGYALQVENAQGEQQAFTARLVILAEGGRSGLREQLGIHCQRTPYGQSAIIANVAFNEPHGGRAFERFTSHGPLAVLPLPPLQESPHRTALVWTRPAGETAQIAALSDEDFLSLLQTEFGFRLGRLQAVGRRYCYPLALEQAAEQARPGLILLGNVAHTLHPVAGQGFNLALRETLALAALVRAAQHGNLALSSPRLAQDYLDCCRDDQRHTVGFSHYMTRLFSNDSEALAWARKGGMFSIDLLPPLKHWFARQAMGMGSPRVMLERLGLAGDQ